MNLGEHRNGPARCRLRRPTALPEHMQAGVVEIVDVWCNVADRRQGHTRDLLASVCLRADVAGKILMLQVDASTPELADMYAAHGFAVVQSSPVILMLRPPVLTRIAMGAHEATTHH